MRLERSRAAPDPSAPSMSRQRACAAHARGAVAERHQRIERGAAGRRGRRRRRRPSKDRGAMARREIEDRGRRSRRRRARPRTPVRAEHAERQVLQREIGAWPLAEATQLLRFGSCVSSSAIIVPRKLLCEAAPAAHRSRAASAGVSSAKRVGRMTQPRLEHEGERVVDLVRRQLGRRGALVGRGGRGRARSCNCARLAPPGAKPAGLGVVDAVDQAHELAHHVAVEPGRPERVLGHHPARREDDEIDIGRAGVIATARSGR